MKKKTKETILTIGFIVVGVVFLMYILPSMVIYLMEMHK